MIDSSYSFLVGPLVAFGALGVILLLCRWVFAPPKQAPRAAAPPRRGDYGLLVPVASVRTGDDAQLLRELLLREGIRCTVTADADGADVLVFQADASRARALVSS